VEKLRIGLIGSGPMGAGLARTCMELDRAEVVAVSDVNRETAQALGRQLGVEAYGDNGRKLLRRQDIAAVIIASPPLAHRRAVERAARAGKDIFCEKPIATNVSDCDAMIAAVERAGVKLQVGQVLRYLPLQATAIELVRSGKYGEPIAVSITRVGGGYGKPADDWRNSHRKSGGLLMEINTHELDLMRQFCGDAVSVCARAHRYLDERMRSPDQIFMVVEFTGGAMGHLHSSAASAMTEVTCKVLCRGGTVFYQRGPGQPGTVWHAAFGQEPVAIPESEIEVENGLRRELREWVEAVLDDQPVTIPGIDGRKAVELAEAAYHSARKGKPVRLPLKRSTGIMSREWEN